ncbi:MAG: FecR domain-containing protein [Bacteroidetes bacterium]|nr:FecR domain-containing protein [Bacteroidota bacterium]
MKKLTSKLIAGLVVAAIIVSATTYLATANESKVVAIVVKALGKAQVKQSSKWSNVGKGSRLYSGDEVQTKGDGYAAVMFLDDKSIVKVKPNSVLKIQGTYEGKSISKQMVMDVGELFVKVSRQKGSFQVVTPTSVASVKGTEFWVLEGTQGTTVIGLEGLIDVLNKISNTTQPVSAGQTGKSGKDGEVTVTETKEEDIPDAGGLSEEIIIKFQDSDGNEKEVRIKY